MGGSNLQSYWSSWVLTSKGQTEMVGHQPTSLLPLANEIFFFIYCWILTRDEEQAQGCFREYDNFKKVKVCERKGQGTTWNDSAGSQLVVLMSCRNKWKIYTSSKPHFTTPHITELHLVLRFFPNLNFTINNSTDFSWWKWHCKFVSVSSYSMSIVKKKSKWNNKMNTPQNR